MDNKKGKVGRPKGSKNLVTTITPETTSHLKSLKGKKRGTPRLYSDKVTEKICSQMVEGVSVNKICKQKGMPTRSTIGNWLVKYPEFRDAFIKAKQVQTYFNVDDILDLADGCDTENSADVQKAKLQVDTRKWIASRLLPKVYGESNERSPVVEVNINTTSDELKSIIDKVACDFGGGDTTTDE